MIMENLVCGLKGLGLLRQAVKTANYFWAKNGPRRLQWLCSREANRRQQQHGVCCRSLANGLLPELGGWQGIWKERL